MGLCRNHESNSTTAQDSNLHDPLLRRSGHVAFISANSRDEDRFWAENRVVEFCKLTAQSSDRPTHIPN